MNLLNCIVTNLHNNFFSFLFLPCTVYMFSVYITQIHNVRTIVCISESYKYTTMYSIHIHTFRAFN